MSVVSPIINGERTRVTIGTKNILLDTTGTDRRAVGVAVDIICRQWQKQEQRSKVSG